MLRILKRVAYSVGFGVLVTNAVYKIKPSWYQDGDKWTLKLMFTPRWTSE